MAMMGVMMKGSGAGVYVGEASLRHRPGGALIMAQSGEEEEAEEDRERGMATGDHEQVPAIQLHLRPK